MPTSPTTTLDLREIARTDRHALIFGSFAAMLPNQTLQLISEHDPQPLQAQLELRSPGLVSWTYLEQGPNQWRVEIGKDAATSKVAVGNCCSGGGCCG